jgi:ribulose-phosphate 3-epimerase
MNEKKMLVAPSILSADFRKLEEEIKAVEEAGADWIHCDIMDGRFVPNISFGPMVVETAKKCTKLPLDVHLMIVHPEEYIKKFTDAGADIITVHAEACEDLQSVITLIRENGPKVGITVNPDKPVDLFLPFLDQIDLVLIMSVYAGFSGQKFIQDVMTKVRLVRDEITRNDFPCHLEIDGGINGETAKISAEYGADVFVAGSFVYGGESYKERIDAVRDGAVAGWKD